MEQNYHLPLIQYSWAPTGVLFSRLSRSTHPLPQITVRHWARQEECKLTPRNMEKIRIQLNLSTTAI